MTKFFLKIIRFLAYKLEKKDILKNTDADDKFLAKIIEYCNHKLQDLSE